MSRTASYADAATPRAVNHNVFNTRYKYLRNAVRARIPSEIAEESSVTSDEEEGSSSSVVLSSFADNNDNASSASEPISDVAHVSIDSEATVIPAPSAPLIPNAPAFPPGISVPYFLPQDMLSENQATPYPRRRRILEESGHVPGWLKPFIAGSRCSAANSRDLILHANIVCCHPTFNVDSDLSVLAHQFTIQASLLKLGPGPDSLAPFTVEMYRTMGALYGPEAANNFRAQLETTCVAYIPKHWADDILGYSQADAQKAVAAVISLAGYIGELYVHGLLPGEQLNDCMLRLLTDTPHTVEHIQAVHRMIMRSRGGHWLPVGFTNSCAAMIRDFLVIFAEATRSVTHDMSLTNTAYAPAVVKLWKDEVFQILYDQMLMAEPIYTSR